MRMAISKAEVTLGHPHPVSLELDARALSDLLADLAISQRDEGAWLFVALTLGRRPDGDVEVEGRLSGRLAVTCVRCLGPASCVFADWRLASRFVQLDEATHGVVSAAEDLGLDPKSALIHYADLLDLGDLLRTSLDGAIPEDPLCAGCAADDG